MKNKIKKLFSIGENEIFRNKWVKNKLEEIEKNSILLDAGCGPQQYRKFCNHLRYKSQDFAQYDGKGDNLGLQNQEWNYGKIDYVGNIWDIKEKDETFDVVLCTEVFEHLPFPNETMKEFSRLLKKDGKLILSAPFCSIPHQTPYYFYNGFSKNWYEKMAELNDFEIIEIVQNGNPTEYVVQELIRLGENNKIKLFFLLLLIVPVIKKFFQVKNKDYLHFGYQVVMKKI